MDSNILIVGVGGQGTLLSSRILGCIADMLGLDCKLSEVHGMAQRGGSVVTHTKIAEKVNSPIIAEGDADFILAFEELEAIRWKHFLSKDGKIIVNTQRIFPMPVITGAAKYPEDIIGRITREADVLAVDALSAACEAGSVKAVNTVMIAVLAKQLGISRELVAEAYKNTVKPKLLDLNLKALEIGYGL